MTTKKYHWNEDTLDHFRFLSSYLSPKMLYAEVEEFVVNDCTLEDNETDEELVNDLINVI